MKNILYLAAGAIFLTTSLHAQSKTICGNGVTADAKNMEICVFVKETLLEDEKRRVQNRLVNKMGLYTSKEISLWDVFIERLFINEKGTLSNLKVEIMSAKYLN